MIGRAIPTPPDRVAVRVKPRLRGVFHEVGFYLAVAVAVPVIVTAEAGTARAVAAVFAGSLAGCFGASALYHRPTWRPTVRSWLARLDHAGILLKLFWVRAPKRLSAAIGLALGWVGVVAFGQLLKLPLAGLLLLVSGGLLYSLGAVIYARRRPDPIPHILGYHEVFHALTLGAAACQYVAVVFFVLPRG